MLDTDSVSYALRGEGQVAARILHHHPSELCMSSVTLAELRYGADKRGSRKLHWLIDTFVESVSVLPFDAPAAAQFGRVAAKLAAQGTSIGAFDAMISAHAVTRKLILVTTTSSTSARSPAFAARTGCR